MNRLVTSFVTVLAVTAAVGGATWAVFSDTEIIAGNTIATARVDLELRGLNDPNGTLHKPIRVSGMVPGQYTDWARVELHNTIESAQVQLYMYVDNLQGAACDKTNLQIATGNATDGRPGRDRNVHQGPLTDLVGPDHRVELTGNPPAATLLAGDFQVIHQRAQLDPSADNTYQNTSCTWDELFVAENVAPSAN